MVTMEKLVSLCKRRAASPTGRASLAGLLSF